MSELRIVRGNTFWTRTTVTAKDYEGTVIDNFDLSQSTDVVVIIRTAYRNIVMTEWSITGNDLEIKWKDIPTGRYGLDVSGIYDGVEWRFYTENVLDIVNSNAQANIPDDTIIKEDFYAIDGVTMMVTQIGGSGGNVQSDWEEEDSSNSAYIKNKPNIVTDEYGHTLIDTNKITIANGYIHLYEGRNSITLDSAGDNGIIIASNNGSDGNIDIQASADVKVIVGANKKFLYGNNEVATIADTKVAIVDHETSDTTFSLTPNVLHKWGEVSSLDLTLESGAAGYLSEYMFEFQSGNTVTSLSLPSTVKWVDTPTIEAHKTYQVSILNGIGLIISVDNE